MRNSLNFYRMQESAETVDRAVLTGPAVVDPRLRRGPRRAAAHAGRAGRSSSSAADDADLGSPDRRRRARGRRHAVARRPRAMTAVTTGIGRRDGGRSRAAARLVPQRGGLPPAARRVARRRRPRAARAATRRSSPTTTSPCSRGCAARALPDRAARRSPGATRSSSSSTALLMALAVIVLGPREQVWLGLAFVLLLVPVDGHRPRLPDHPEQADDPRAGRRARRSSRSRDPGDIPEHLIAAAAAGGFLFVAAWPIPAAWAWATSSSRS